jgi:hypothetical protein
MFTVSTDQSDNGTWYLIWNDKLGAKGFVAEDWVPFKLSEKEILKRHGLL